MRIAKCCILLLFTPYVNAATEPDLVEEIFLAQRQNFMRLKSISMIYSEDWKPSEYMKEHSSGPIMRNSRHLVFGFKKEGEKFRVDTALDGTKVSPEQESSKIFEIIAFDLNTYQRFDKRSRWLAFMDRDINPLEEGNLPLIMPYRYLFLSSTLSFKNIQNKAFWDGLKRDIKNTQKAMIEGQDCIRTDISFSDKARLCQTYWAKEFGFYPIKIQVSNLDGKKLVEIIVKQVIKQETSNGSIFIPMVMEQTEWYETGGYKGWILRHTIDSNSLSINEDIPDEVFTIPLHMAKSITDYTNSWNNYHPKNAPAYAMKGKRLIEFTLSKLGGGNVSLSQEKAKVVVLDFWTTWCGSCIAAFPGFERVQKWAIENELPVVIYCINVKEGSEKVEDFRSKHKMHIPILMDKGDVVRKKYNVTGFPTMFIIANGTIQHVHIGGGGAQEMLLRQEKQLKEEIKALLIELGEKGDYNE